MVYKEKHGLQKQNSLSFSKQLRKTAIIANSRIILHELLHKKETVIEPTTPTTAIPVDSTSTTAP